MNSPFLIKLKKILVIYVIYMEDKYEGLSDEELKEIFEDMEADYWIDYYQSLCDAAVGFRNLCLNKMSP